VCGGFAAGHPTGRQYLLTAAAGAGRPAAMAPQQCGSQQQL